ncbi:hypothetical protein CJ030_MR5G023024 [Morella rubra]|uniref:Uncharacterized protein n=1 Tax=Morella rubra TaxID=262757 RepID=A0A6A1VLD0_9ROSI|nr:hypothetical protein CJ030_MR5G023024 [Morella rubra]
MEENRREDVHLKKGRETHLSKSTREEPRPGNHLEWVDMCENEHEVVERWLREESNHGDDDHARSEDGVEVVGIGRRDPMAEPIMMLEGKKGPGGIVTMIVTVMVMEIDITTKDLERKTII